MKNHLKQRNGFQIKNELCSDKSYFTYLNKFGEKIKIQIIFGKKF